MHRTCLASFVLSKIKTIKGVILTHSLVSLCDTGITGTLIKDSVLPFGAKPIITKNQQYQQQRIVLMNTMRFHTWSISNFPNLLMGNPLKDYKQTFFIHQHVLMVLF